VNINNENEEDTPKDYFTEKEFNKAKEESPDIFEWINQPEKFI
jgi:hypothetical protein